MGRKLQQCKYCDKTVNTIIKHLQQEHPDIYREQEELVVSLWEQGISSRKIAAREDVVFSGGTSVRRVLSKHLTTEELESGRRNMIGKDVKAAYAAGERDWVTEINVARVKSDEGRAANSEGLKRSYEEGRRTSWNKDETAKTDERIATAAEKTSVTMREKYRNGELKTTFPSGPDNMWWKEDRSKIANHWRKSQDFRRIDKKSLLKHYKYRCAWCEIKESELEIEKAAVNSKKLMLECDHIIAIQNGGVRDWQQNGQVLCSRCHMIKSLLEKRVQSKERQFEITTRYKYAGLIFLSDFYNGIISKKDECVDVGDTRIKILSLKDYTTDKYFASDAVKSNSIVFFEDEWYGKRTLCLSMLDYHLNKIDNKIGARSCVVSRENTDEFFEDNHISGNTRRITSWALKHDDEIVAALSLRKPFIEKHQGSIELARFAIKQGVVVPGGFSKLLSVAKAWALDEGYASILTYADLRFGTGQVYANNGFESLGQTGLDYFYTDGRIRYNRFKFRARDGKPEKQIALEAGVWRVYGAGSKIYKMTL